MKVECRNCEAFFAESYRGGDSCTGVTECRRHAPSSIGDQFPRPYPWCWCLDFIPRRRQLGQPPEVLIASDNP